MEIKLVGGEQYKPWPEPLAPLAVHPYPPPHPSTRISKELNRPIPRSSQRWLSRSPDHPIQTITRSWGVPPQGSSQIGVDLSDGHPRSSQIGVGFSDLPQFGVGFRDRLPIGVGFSPALWFSVSSVVNGFGVGFSG